jgi:hypothetical protein
MIVSRAPVDFLLSVLVFELNSIAINLVQKESFVTLFLLYHAAPIVALYSCFFLLFSRDCQLHQEIETNMRNIMINITHTELGHLTTPLNHQRKDPE